MNSASLAAQLYTLSSRFPRKISRPCRIGARSSAQAQRQWRRSHIPIEPLEVRRLLVVAPIAFGEVKMATVPVAGTDIHTFNGQSGDVISIAAASTGGYYDVPIIELFRGTTS